MKRTFSSIELYKKHIKHPHTCYEQNRYYLENSSGYGKIEIYQVLPGIEVVYNNMNMEFYEFFDQKVEKVLEFNHCKLGCYECEYSDGKCTFLSNGDFGVSGLAKSKVSASFPLGRYLGISVILKKEEMVEAACSFYQEYSIEIEKIWKLFDKFKGDLLIRSNPTIAQIFLKLYDFDETICIGYLKIKMLELLFFLKDYDYDMDDSILITKYFNSNYVKIVKEIKRFIQQNIKEHYTLNQLSEMFHIPLTSMKECFKGVYGVPIYSCLKKYRIQMAMELLKNYELTIDEISEKVGYANSNKFRTAFKREVGMTPTEYKKVTKWIENG